MALDLNTLWDFGRPDISEQRFRAALLTSTGNEALISPEHSTTRRVGQQPVAGDASLQFPEMYRDEIPMAGGLLSTITVRQAVLADLEVIAELFNQYRQFQGKAADRSACRAFLLERFNHPEFSRSPQCEHVTTP